MYVNIIKIICLPQTSKS